MARRRLFALTLIAVSLAPVTAGAGPECQCRGNGKIFEQGELACIKTNAGLKLARCDMALNNSSWTIVRDDCPEALDTPLPATLATLAAELAGKPRLRLSN